MWLISGATEDPEDNAVIEKHSANAVHSAVTSLMNGICTEHEDSQQESAH
jgi:hypothetical protein